MTKVKLSISDLQAADTDCAFHVTASDFDVWKDGIAPSDKNFPLRDAIPEPGDTVELTVAGYQGQSDGFPVYEIRGKFGEYTITGAFFNRDRYEAFLRKIGVERHVG